MLAATDIADLLVAARRAVPRGHGIVAGLVRDAVDERPAALGASRRTSCARTPSTSTRTSPRCCSSASWLESKVCEGGTVARPRVREQLELAARRCSSALMRRGAAARTFFERPVARGRARPDRLRRSARRRRRA